MQQLEIRQLQKLARMILFGVSPVQIATACGITESRISQIKTTEEYKQVEQEIASEQYEEQQLVNQGWDGIEALGINKVVQHLQQNPEPEFALKAAMIANKAVRRGQFKNTPIAQSAGARTVIVLNQAFVNKINQTANENVERLNDNRKTSNFLPPKDVQDLLYVDQTTGEKQTHDASRAITSAETYEVENEVERSLSEMQIDTLT